MNKNWLQKPTTSRRETREIKSSEHHTQTIHIDSQDVKKQRLDGCGNSKKQASAEAGKLLINPSSLEFNALLKSFNGLETLRQNCVMFEHNHSKHAADQGCFMIRLTLTLFRI